MLFCDGCWWFCFCLVGLGNLFHVSLYLLVKYIQSQLAGISGLTVSC